MATRVKKLMQNWIGFGSENLFMRPMHVEKFGEFELKSEFYDCCCLDKPTNKAEFSHCLNYPTIDQQERYPSEYLRMLRTLSYIYILNRNTAADACTARVPNVCSGELRV